MKGPVASLGILLAVAGCTSSMQGRDSASVVGGFADARQAEDPIASTLTGGMNGGLITGEIGRGLSDGDRREALTAEYQALEYGEGGELVRWQGSRAATRGEIVAGPPYRVGSQDCRQYVHTVFSDGDSTTGRGAACRNGDGSWTPLG